MIISDLYIEKYRNLRKLTFSFHPELTYVIGDHATGKTNLLHLLRQLCQKKKEGVLVNGHELNLDMCPIVLSTMGYRYEDINTLLKQLDDRLEVEWLLSIHPRLAYVTYRLLEQLKGLHGFLNLLILVDEPEIHLDPYLQRKLIRWLKSLLFQENPFFIQVLALWKIDISDAQMVVVTHSTDGLVDDYRHLIRLYYQNRQLYCACGIRFHLENRLDQLLRMNFHEMKEAFFAKAALIVEGQTEYGFFKAYDELKDLGLDERGICILNAHGQSMIEPMRALLARFGIKAVCIYDGDVKSQHEDVDPSLTFFTQTDCFETELVAHLKKMGQLSVLSDWPEEKIRHHLLTHKGVESGRKLALRLPAHWLPEIYAQAILKVKQLASMNDGLIRK